MCSCGRLLALWHERKPKHSRILKGRKVAARIIARPDQVSVREGTYPSKPNGKAPANGNGLDQFYTKPAVAKKCWDAAQRIMKRMGVDERKCRYIEPAAGCGCFYQILPPRRRVGVDIEPRTLPRVNGEGIIKADYLRWRPNLFARPRHYVVIGNPPFGKRGRLAVAFFNHSDFADIIAFIVPVSFRKYTIHRQLLPEYALVAQEPLANDSFYTPDGKNYAVNAEFQVWARQPGKLKDKRERKPPPIAHPDFEMRQYNNTPEALRVFDAPFHFAVPCQGYQDYTRRETRPEDCEKHKQWMLFTARNKRVLSRLRNLDFGGLAHECATATPGFRKNDVVKFYESAV